MRLALVLCAGLCLTPAAALGVTKAAQKKAAGLVKEAERLYNLGKYHESAALLKKANELDPSPKLIYNIARAYDQAGDLQTSLEHYRQFVAQEEADPTLVKRANLAMDRLRSLLAKEEASREVQDRERQRLEEEARTAQERAKAEAEAARRQKEAFEARQRAEEEARRKETSKGKIAAYAVGGVAVAGLATGAIFGLNASAARSAFSTAPSGADKQRLEAETRSHALIADACFGLGIAAGIATVFLFPRGEGGAKKEVGVVVAPAPGGAGVVVRF